MTVPQPELLQLSAGNIDRHGAYLMDLGSRMYLWLGAAISDKFCQEVLDMPTFQNVPEGLVSIKALYINIYILNCEIECKSPPC